MTFIVEDDLVERIDVMDTLYHTEEPKSTLNRNPNWNHSRYLHMLHSCYNVQILLRSYLTERNSCARIIRAGSWGFESFTLVHAYVNSIGRVPANWWWSGQTHPDSTSGDLTQRRSSLDGLRRFESCPEHRGTLQLPRGLQQPGNF